MAKLAYAAAYIRANMPFGIRYLDPVLSEQQAWDVAAFMISKPRPPARREPYRICASGCPLWLAFRRRSG